MEPVRVLFGYDGSTGADAALAAVATLPWSTGTHLRVIGVRDAHLRFLRPLADEILFAEFEEVVSRAARCLRAEVPVAAIDERVVRGPAVPRILAEAERLGADLIVVGSRNQGPMRSAFLGSVAHDLAAAARVPVLVARGSHFGRVLLVLDGSEAARAAMRIVSFRHSPWTGSVGCKGLPLALRLITSSPRSENAPRKSFCAVALDFNTFKSKCGAVDQPPVLTSTPETPMRTAWSSNVLNDREPRLSDTNPSFILQLPFAGCRTPVY